MKCTDIDIGFSGLYADGFASLRKIAVDQSAEIFVGAMAAFPQGIQLAKSCRRHPERAPYPVRGGVLLFDLDFLDSFAFQHDGVEKFRMLDWEQQKRQSMIGQRGQCVLWKPDGIRQSDQHRLLVAHDAGRPKNGVAQTIGARLHHICNPRACVTIAEITENIGFSRRDHEAYLVSSAEDQALDKIFRYSARALYAVLRPATDR